MDAGVGIRTRGRKKISVPGRWACLPSAPLSDGRTGETPARVPSARVGPQPRAVIGGVERGGKAKSERCPAGQQVVPAPHRPPQLPPCPEQGTGAWEPAWVLREGGKQVARFGVRVTQTIQR